MDFDALKREPMPRGEMDPTLPVYLRSGDWRPSGKSWNYSMGHWEEGVSVYEIDAQGRPVAPEDGVDDHFAAMDLRERMAGEDPKYVVQGELIGRGHDGEPLLADARVVGEWVNPLERWHGFPFTRELGEGPGAKDTPPERTAEGGFVLYHGTSRDAAKAIMGERRLRPDDMGCVGVGTTREAVGTYASMKRDGVRLRLVLDKDWLAGQAAGHEIGGSGRDQFLIESLEKGRKWEGIPPEAILEIGVSEAP